MNNKLEKTKVIPLQDMFHFIKAHPWNLQNFVSNYIQKRRPAFSILIWLILLFKPITAKKTQINIFVTFYQKFKFFIDKINEI